MHAPVNVADGLSVQRDDFSVFAAVGLLRRFRGALDCNAIELVLAEETHDLGVHRLPYTVGFRAGCGAQPHAQGIGAVWTIWNSSTSRMRSSRKLKANGGILTCLPSV